MTYTPTDTDLLAAVRAMGDAEAAAAGAIPDPAWVASQRRLLVALYALYGAGNVAPTVEPDDYDQDGYGGLLWTRIPPRPVRLIDGCPAMTRLADDGYGGAL